MLIIIRIYFNGAHEKLHVHAHVYVHECLYACAYDTPKYRSDPKTGTKSPGQVRKYNSSASHVTMEKIKS